MKVELALNEDTVALITMAMAEYEPQGEVEKILFPKALLDFHDALDSAKFAMVDNNGKD